MKTVYLKTATHIHAEIGAHSVSDAECDRLCALGVAEPVREAQTEPKAEAPAEVKKRTRKKADK